MVDEKYLKILELTEKVLKCDQLIYSSRNNPKFADVQRIMVETRDVMLDEIINIHNKPIENSNTATAKTNSNRRTTKTTKK